MAMKPSQLVEYLTASIQAGMTTLLVGSPGIGKTSLVKRACKDAGADLVISHPAVADPTDAKGFPWIENGVASFVPFGDVRTLMEATEPTVWFLDDFGQAPPAVQASYMPWLLEGQVAQNHLPDCVTIIAATNRRTDRAAVSGILEPVKSRFDSIVEFEPDLDEWCQWAITDGARNIPPELVAYLRFKRGENMLNRFEPSADLVNCPTPRTWENAGKNLMLNLPPEIEAQALVGAVGQGAATELMSFLQMYRQLPNVDAILVDPDAVAIPSQPNVLYAVTTALASRISTSTIGRIFRYGERLVQAGHGEFAALMVRDALRRKPEVQQTPAFTKLMSGELGQMVGGGLASVGRGKKSK